MTAYECKEVFSPDGKRRVRREWIVGDCVVKGVVAICLIVAGMVLVLSDHATVSSLPTVAGLLNWLRK